MPIISNDLSGANCKTHQIQTHGGKMSKMKFSLHHAVSDGEKTGFKIRTNFFATSSHFNLQPSFTLVMPSVLNQPNEKICKVFVLCRSAWVRKEGDKKKIEAKTSRREEVCRGRERAKSSYESTRKQSTLDRISRGQRQLVLEAIQEDLISTHAKVNR